MSTLPSPVKQNEILDDVTRRGMALYDGWLRDELERDHPGAFVAVHPDTGDYDVAPNSHDALTALRARQPAGPLFLCHIAPRTPGGDGV